MPLFPVIAIDFVEIALYQRLIRLYGLIVVSPNFAVENLMTSK